MQLVLINISDHATRMRANKLGEGNNYRVLGCLLGQQSGRVVDISNSLEINYHIGELGINIDEAYLTRKQEQCRHTRPIHCLPFCQIMVYKFALLLADKQTFPKLDTVGWYSTGSEVEEADMQIHKMVICCLLENQKAKVL